MTGLRILLLWGLLVIGMAVLMLWKDDRVANPEKSLASPRDPRVGRSTLSHGGPSVGGLPDTQGHSLEPLQNIPSEQSSQATKVKR